MFSTLIDNMDSIVKEVEDRSDIPREAKFALYKKFIGIMIDSLEKPIPMRIEQARKFITQLQLLHLDVREEFRILGNLKRA